MSIMLNWYFNVSTNALHCSENWLYCICADNKWQILSALVLLFLFSSLPTKILLLFTACILEFLVSPNGVGYFPAQHEVEVRCAGWRDKEQTWSHSCIEVGNTNYDAWFGYTGSHQVTSLISPSIAWHLNSDTSPASTQSAQTFLQKLSPLVMAADRGWCIGLIWSTPI